MDAMQLLVDLHKGQSRQGPGGDAETELALRLARIDPNAPLRIADIGCGTGASTLALAGLTNAQITAVDFLPAFLDVLEGRAAALGLYSRITTLCRSMDDLPFDDEAYDLIWSEGAIYNIGFENGVSAWHRYLKPGGLLVVSEITWLTAERPAELEAYWQAAYPDVDVASAKMAILEQHGYAPRGYFVLPEPCWLDNYYRPLQASFTDFVARNGGSDAARAIVAGEEEEIALYEKYKAYFSYGVYIAQKLAEPAP